MNRIFLPLCAFLLFAPAAWADSATACHCFQDRTFDAGRPAAVDPYLLATTQNSLLAAAFDVPKKDIVLTRMNGTVAGDLWIAHSAAKVCGLPAAELLAERRQAPSWAAVLRRHGITGASLGPGFAGAGDDETLAAAAVRTILLDRFGAAPSAVEQLRLSGASPPETILAVFLSRKSGRPAPALLADVRAGRSTWGALLHGLGIPAGGVDGEIRKLLR